MEQNEEKLIIFVIGAMLVMLGIVAGFMIYDMKDISLYQIFGR